MLINESIIDYLNILSSDKPSPGAGSVAALNGALGVSLMQMVINLSIGKKELKSCEKILKEKNNQAEIYKRFFLNAIDEDCSAYPKVLNAYKLSKNTEEEKKIRYEKIQEAYKYATNIPFNIGKKAFEFLNIIDELIVYSNKNVITDAYAAVIELEACIEAAFINVDINLKFIEDKSFRLEIEEEIKSIKEGSKTKSEEIKNRIKKLM